MKVSLNTKTVIWLITGAILFGIWSWQITLFNSYTLRKVGDSGIFLRAAQTSWLSRDIWAGERAPTIPLLYKTFHVNWSQIVKGQFIFSLIAWLMLAIAISSTLKSLYKPLAIILVLIFSTMDEVFLWHKVLLSESFTLSLFALFLAGWVYFLQKVSWTRLILLLAVSLTFALSRDTNSYLILMLSGLTVGTLLFVKNKRLGSTLAIGYLIIFLLGNLSANNGQRWVYPFYNTLSQRILTNETFTAYFAQQGMPNNNSLMERAGKWAPSDDHAFFVNPELEEFRQWTRAEGKLTYLNFLFTHPYHFLFTAPHHFSEVIEGIFNEYAPKELNTPVTGYPLSNFLLHRLAYALFLVLVPLILIDRLCQKPDSYRHPLWLITAVLYATAYPHYLVTWHGDAMEWLRHGLVVTIQARLAILFALLYWLDTLQLQIASSKKSNRITLSSPPPPLPRHKD